MLRPTHNGRHSNCRYLSAVARWVALLLAMAGPGVAQQRVLLEVPELWGGILLEMILKDEEVVTVLRPFRSSQADIRIQYADPLPSTNEGRELLVHEFDAWWDRANRPAPNYPKKYWFCAAKGLERVCGRLTEERFDAEISQNLINRIPPDFMAMVEEASPP